VIKPHVSQLKRIT